MSIEKKPKKEKAVKKTKDVVVSDTPVEVKNKKPIYDYHIFIFTIKGRDGVRAVLLTKKEDFEKMFSGSFNNLSRDLITLVKVYKIDGFTGDLTLE